MIGEFLNKKICCILIMFLITGCQSIKVPFLSEGYANKELFIDIKDSTCVNESLINPGYTPSDYYRMMINCIHANKYTNAILYYMVAGSYSYYDALRVNTQYSEALHYQLYEDNFNMLSMEQQDKFWVNARKLMADNKQKKFICDKVYSYGPPSYVPNYMYVHGMKEHTLKVTSWRSVVNRFMSCE